MGKVLYNLAKTPESLLFDLINSANNTPFEEGHIRFGPPAVRGDGRCDVVVTAVESSNWKGSVTVNYKRLDMTYFFASRGVLLAIGTDEFVDSVKPENIITELYRQYGLFFRLDEIFLSFIDQPDPQDPNTIRHYFTITPHPTHLVWEGTMIGEYKVVDPTSEAITSVNLDGMNNPEGSSLTTFPLEYIYYDKLDGTAYKDQLNALVEGFIFSDATQGLWGLGQQLTGDIWTYTNVPTEEYNIYNASVMYNGVNDGEWGIDNSVYANVLVIKVSGGYNLKVAGHLVIPYNN